ncbi:MAG: outer membrane beta-barrel domain-containing protein [Pseudoalteromonas spongiae]
MEIRYHGIFLTALATLALTFSAPSNANNEQQVSPVVDPQIARTDIEEAQIDSDDFEFGVYGGVISIADFSSTSLVGAKLAYHINEDFFSYFKYGTATAGETSYEKLSGGAKLLTDEERDYQLLDLGIGYNLKGETFVSQNLTLNSAYYFTLGAGTTEFGGDDRFTVSIGAGYRMLLNDFVTVQIDMTDYVFESDILGDPETVHNLAFTLGLSVYF